jgi:type II secretory ATPase GspE/PulE/Tfp pilus assembly ATPase PilB-like protein
MGVEPYLISPVLICSIAQRLVRTFCPGAEQETELSPSERKMIEEQLQSLPKEHRFDVPKTVYEAVRTPTCPTGMRGRMAVFEVMEMTPKLERVILDDPIESKLWEISRQNGMLTMREDAILKAVDKKVPYSEVNNLGTMMLTDEEVDAGVQKTATPSQATKDI